MIVIRQMFYEPKKFDGTFEVLSYFFEIIKTWYELFDRCFTKQKNSTELWSFAVLFEIDKSWLWVRLSTKFCLTFWNWLSWYQLFGTWWMGYLKDRYSADPLCDFHQRHGGGSNKHVPIVHRRRKDLQGNQLKRRCCFTASWSGQLVWMERKMAAGV